MAAKAAAFHCKFLITMLLILSIVGLCKVAFASTEILQRNRFNSHNPITQMRIPAVSKTTDEFLQDQIRGMRWICREAAGGIEPARSSKPHSPCMRTVV